MRAEKLDDGLFLIADELIWELANGVFAHPPITILAESEYTGYRARIIRLRYPASIWDLPIAAHEFGHVFASEVRPLDFRELAKDKKVDAKLLEEHFADIFATYALGPAFACTMILHRFDPSNAHPAFEWSHPGDAKRVYCILETLRKMEDSRGWGSWLPWVDENVRKPWEASLTAVDQRRDLDRKVVEELDRWLEKVLGLFEGGLIQNVKYANESWNRAHVLADRLRKEEPPESVLDKNDTVRDLLNAAWYCRIEQAKNSDQVSAISYRTTEWCRTLIQTGKQALRLTEPIPSPKPAVTEAGSGDPTPPTSPGTEQPSTTTHQANAVQQSTELISIFYSYSHKDEELKDKLEEHLTLLKRQGVISGWHDRQIVAGTEWADQIGEHLESARMILLLVSSSFLASDYCYGKEMKRALERHNKGEARVIPTILRPCDWHGAPFGKLQALPKGAKAVTLWANRDKAFTNVAEGIRKAVEAMRRGV